MTCISHWTCSCWLHAVAFAFEIICVPCKICRVRVSCMVKDQIQILTLLD